MTKLQKQLTHRIAVLLKSPWRGNRRLYYFPQTSGLSKYVIGNGARCVTYCSGLLWQCKRERQSSLEYNRMSPLPHPYLQLCFYMIHIFTFMSLPMSAGPAPLLLSFNKGKENHSLNPPVSQLYSRPTGYLPVHFTCLFWDLPNLFSGKFQRQWPVIPSLAQFLSCRSLNADFYVCKGYYKCHDRQKIHINIYFKKTTLSATESK